MQQTHKKINKWKRIELKWFQGSTLFDDATADTKKRDRRLPLLFKQAGIIIFQFSNNYSYILFTKLPWPGDSEGTFRSSSQAATYPSVYHSIS